MDELDSELIAEELLAEIERDEVELREEDEEAPAEEELEIWEEVVLLPVPADETDLEFTVSELLIREELAKGVKWEWEHWLETGKRTE